MHTLEVGKLYIPGRTRWPEAVEYNWYDGGHELRMFYARPSVREIAAVRKGRAEFGLFRTVRAVFLLARFGDMNWMDAPYSYHLLPADRRPDLNVELDPETRFLCQILLIDASTGILHVLRGVTFSPEFSRELLDAVRAQAQAGFSTRNYDEEINRVYASNTTDQLVRSAWIRCVGGA